MLTADEKLTAILQKIKWAKKHLGDLEIARDTFFANDAYEVETYDDPQTGDHIFKMLYVNPVREDFSLILGDALHNTRSALDHLMWQLASPAKRGRKTYFPIFSDAATCKATDIGKEQFVSANAAKRIKDAEPYKRGKGNDLWILNKLDIADKHHELLTSLVCMSYSLAGRGSQRSGPMHIEYMTFSAGQMVKIGEPLKTGDVFMILPKEYQNVEFAFDINVSEPNVIENISAIALLSNLISHADRLIRGFKPDLV
jgi:hypothetical protein